MASPCDAGIDPGKTGWVVVEFQDRTWWMCPVDYVEGNLNSISGTAVAGDGMAFTTSMVGRRLIASGKFAGIVTAVPGSGVGGE